MTELLPSLCGAGPGVWHDCAVGSLSACLHLWRVLPALAVVRLVDLDALQAFESHLQSRRYHNKKDCKIFTEDFNDRKEANKVFASKEVGHS